MSLRGGVIDTQLTALSAVAEQTVKVEAGLGDGKADLDDLAEVRSQQLKMLGVLHYQGRLIVAAAHRDPEHSPPGGQLGDSFTPAYSVSPENFVAVAVQMQSHNLTDAL